VLGIDLGDSITLSQLSQRQGVKPDFIYKLLPETIKTEATMSDLESALADSLYKGYIKTQSVISERLNHNDNLKLPNNFQFDAISGLSREMVERLERAKPQTFADVRRIKGLTPAALSTLLVYITAHNQPRKQI
jgi:tRNA uridine 5-carboxymethylaminomethyl modification enzyme